MNVHQAVCMRSTQSQFGSQFSVHCKTKQENLRRIGLSVYKQTLCIQTDHLSPLRQIKVGYSSTRVGRIAQSG
jgi:hypothetical protein